MQPLQYKKSLKLLLNNPKTFHFFVFFWLLLAVTFLVIQLHFITFILFFLYIVAIQSG